MRTVLGDLKAGADMQRDVWASHETPRKFMDNEERNIDFLKKMQCVSDGKGGVVWVRTENVQRWQDFVSAAAAPSSCTS